MIIASTRIAKVGAIVLRDCGGCYPDDEHEDIKRQLTPNNPRDDSEEGSPSCGKDEQQQYDE